MELHGFEMGNHDFYHGVFREHREQSRVKCRLINCHSPPRRVSSLYLKASMENSVTFPQCVILLYETKIATSALSFT